MNLRTIWIVLRKELLDMVRDRRMVIFMVAVPLLLMPLLMYGATSLMISMESKMAESSSEVAIFGAAEAPLLIDYFENSDKNLANLDSAPDAVAGLMVERMSGANAFINIRQDIASIEAAQQMLRDKSIDAILIIPTGFEASLAPTVDAAQAVNFAGDLVLRIEYISTDSSSEKAYDRLSDSIDDYKENIVAARLASEGYDNSLIEPWKRNLTDLATKQEIFGKILGTILPYMIIIMTFAGSVFPATQLGAGEKEQKTLETLLASPVGRAEMVTGKFLTIMLAGTISASLSLLGMWYAFNKMGDKLGKITDMISMNIDLMSIAMTLLLILPLTLVFASIMLALSVMAKNFREAQSYMAPVQIVLILPAMASMLPGIELDYKLALIPVMNISLVMREVLAGKAMEIMPYYLTTIASTLVLAAVSIAICAWMFKREQAIFKN